MVLFGVKGLANNNNILQFRAKAIEALSIICIMGKAFPYTMKSKLLTVAESAVGVKW